MSVVTGGLEVGSIPSGWRDDYSGPDSELDEYDTREFIWNYSMHREFPAELAAKNQHLGRYAKVAAYCMKQAEISLCDNLHEVYIHVYRGVWGSHKKWQTDTDSTYQARAVVNDKCGLLYKNEQGSAVRVPNFSIVKMSPQTPIRRKEPQELDFFTELTVTLQEPDLSF